MRHESEDDLMHFSDNEDLGSARTRKVNDALKEDIGRGDWTARLVPADQLSHARVIAKEPTVVCGQTWFDACVHALDPAASVLWEVADGDEVRRRAGRLHGSGAIARTAERRAFRSQLPSDALLGGVYHAALRQAIGDASSNPRGCAVLDTRKTLPGLRQA